ncbi:MAG: hypothetical protein C0503_00295 [Gemmatimonas sp.]|nr:hypothetical protein [Gemmatimonas sp.]
MSQTIFVQMAAYRDPELIPTLTDALDRASDPRRLHFCIAWQHGDELDRAAFAPIEARTRLTILDIPFGESHGACWARHAIQQRYDGEDFTLQLDSHHRFVDGWDSLCISMVEELQAAGVPKPLLTAYLPSYDPQDDPAARQPDPWHLTFDRFIPEGAIFFTPAAIPGWRELQAPTRSRFYSAHFAFTLGAFAREVQHNPEFYFHGEEITIAARAYTHGYDLFHPHRLVAWHEYTRRGRTKHWDDHSSTWGQRNTSTHVACRRLFGMDEFMDDSSAIAEERTGPYGFGTLRSFEDYERYSGISFRRRAVTSAVLEHREPTPADNRHITYEEFTASTIPRFKHCIDVGYDHVPLDDYDFWVVSFKDADGEELFRQDAQPDEIARMREDPDRYCKIWRQFDTDVRPRTWVVWPHSISQGWCAPVVGQL